MNEYIESDLFRYTGKTGWKAFLYQYQDKTFRWQVAFRLYNSKGLEHILGILLWKLNLTRKQIQIPPHTKIGYGLYIGHGGPLICNETAVIGNNCNLSQWTTIGANEGKAAVIGDNVYIGPSCCIVENVKIGNNVTIGAGAVVTKDKPQNATEAGNYAKVQKYTRPGRFIANQWVKKR